MIGFTRAFIRQSMKLQILNSIMRNTLSCLVVHQRSQLVLPSCTLLPPAVSPHKLTFMKKTNDIKHVMKIWSNCM